MSNHFSADNLTFPGDDRRLDLTDLYPDPRQARRSEMVAGEAGDHSMHHPYNQTDHRRSPLAADTPSAAAFLGGA